MSERYDTTFSLPSVDDDPDTEIGVLLMGFGAERLLAGLGVACRAGATDPATDPATVTLVVDQLRHGARPAATFDDAVADGARRWRDARAGLPAADLHPGPRSAALRRLWESTAAVIAASADVFPQLRTACAAERVYLTACWSRPEEITQIVEERCPT
jgi:hypothetical protein